MPKSIINHYSASHNLLDIRLEAKYLQYLIQTQQTIAIYLITGIQLKGVLCGYDTYTLSLTTQQLHTEVMQLIYKHMVSTVAVM